MFLPATPADLRLWGGVGFECCKVYDVNRIINGAQGKAAGLAKAPKCPQAPPPHRVVRWYGAHGGGEEDNSGDEDSRDKDSGKEEDSGEEESGGEQGDSGEEERDSWGRIVGRRRRIGWVGADWC